MKQVILSKCSWVRSVGPIISVEPCSLDKPTDPVGSILLIDSVNSLFN